jgi:hypothetical protein
MDKWVGDSLLCESFPRLFSISTQKEAMVDELVVIDGDVMSWNLSWRRRLFVWEDEILLRLLGVLDSARFSNNADSWRWVLAPDGCFTVKTAYESLARDLVVGPLLPALEAKVFKDFWCSPAPSKLLVFSWQFLHDRVPTKDNLILRGILPHGSDGLCVWCGTVMESSTHLFLHCRMACVVWYEIFRWLGVVIVMPPNPFYLFECLSAAAKSIKDRKGFRFIWHTVIWSIWLARNNFIFNNVNMEPLELVEEVKVLSWRWSADRLKISPCLFYEWVWDPGACFHR